MTSLCARSRYGTCSKGMSARQTLWAACRPRRTRRTREESPANSHPKARHESQGYDLNSHPSHRRHNPQTCASFRRVTSEGYEFNSYPPTTVRMGEPATCNVAQSTLGST